MDTHKLVEKISVKAWHLPSSQIVETTISFEDRGDSIYYCWTFNDSFGKLIAGKCLPISNRIIDTDKFNFAINHSKYSIDHYRIDRQRVFEVTEIQKLQTRSTSTQHSVLRQLGRRINPHLSSTISHISGWPNTDEQKNIFSASVSLIGCSSGLGVFQMPCRTQSCGRYMPFNWTF